MPPEFVPVLATTRPAAGPIVLFDGECNLCRAVVRFVTRRDKRRCFRFVALQLSEGRQLLAEHDLPASDCDAVVLIEDGRAFDASAAVFRIVRRLAFPWPLFFPFILLPRSVCDAAYRFVARRRYRWFGQCEYCPPASSDCQSTARTTVEDAL